jgi:hypothetical protein
MSLSQHTSTAPDLSDTLKGENAARLIIDNDPAVAHIHDPRTTEFANAMMDTAASELKNAAGIFKDLVERATAGAEDLAVATFQGIIEVIQNADDVRATQVWFALRQTKTGKQLLLVHDGAPVTCLNVLGMVLPYQTSKTNRTDQRGRFGIGMKTLLRIADTLAVHSAPYHFSCNQLDFDRLPPEPALPGFYDPMQHTLIVADLNSAFDESELTAWFDSWRHDGLLFLASVSQLTWCELDGSIKSQRALTFSDWTDTGYTLHHSGMHKLQCRFTKAQENDWTIWRASVAVPEHLHPAHKARSEVTDISIAISSQRTQSGVYIGFRTDIPTTLTFSLDAQFDPSTSRESIIENDWNRWLIERTAEVVGNIAAGMLATVPKTAWRLIPLTTELVDPERNSVLNRCFSTALNKTRTWLAQHAVVQLPSGHYPFSALSYEAQTLKAFLSEDDVERIHQGQHALHRSARDTQDRWREVIKELNVSSLVSTDELLDSLENKLFNFKPAPWWVRAGALLVEHHEESELFDRAFLLSHLNEPISCSSDDVTDIPLVLNPSSEFAQRWQLLQRLHVAYEDGDAGEQVITWLDANAAFVSQANTVIELSAFAEKFEQDSIEISEDDLRSLRDMFDKLRDTEAKALGIKIGAILKLDGYVYKNGKIVRQKVRLSESYLCKTLDSENSTWPDAADNTPGIQWVGAKYEAILKTNITRGAKRKREDGTQSRGARKFLLLLGVEYSPRVQKIDEHRYGVTERRRAELRANGAELVYYDFESPDLERVIQSIKATSKQHAKRRSPALLTTLTKNWQRLYVPTSSVPSAHKAIKYFYPKANVTAAWLNTLRDVSWVAVGKGETVLPHSAVLKTPETQTLYQTFICGVNAKDLDKEFLRVLNIITDVRIGDLLTALETIRTNEEIVIQAQTQQIYRAIAKHCPATITFATQVGELSIQELRTRFLEGSGLIYVSGRGWSRPNELFRGLDIFHGKRPFVPGGTTSHCQNLWYALNIPEPSLADCIQYCRELSHKPYSTETESQLMDVYRYMETRLEKEERGPKDKLRTLPLFCSSGWVTQRPIYSLDNPELREQLGKALPDLQCWVPPCDIQYFPGLVKALRVVELNPQLQSVNDNTDSKERGEQERLRFGHAIEHLSNELAKSMPDLRDKLPISWDKFKNTTLYIYDSPATVRALAPEFPGGFVDLSLKAVSLDNSQAFHFYQDAIGDRDFGGRVIASLFPSKERRRIDAEWTIAWKKSLDSVAEPIRLASDEARTEAMEDIATNINAALKHKINVTAPKSRSAQVQPRTLKPSVGAMVRASVKTSTGTAKTTTTTSKGARGLKTTPPPVKSGTNTSISTPVAYTNADLEQRGWELLSQALDTTNDQRIIDFRRNHGVGADGVIDWKLFIEMKATGRGPQSQIEMSNNEYQRAKERGNNFILALVSGLETGQTDEIRLIFDPVNCANAIPTNGIRLGGLLEAPSVVIQFETDVNE